MTDIWGNPTPHRVYVLVDPYVPRRTPYPGLCLLVMLQAVVAFLYVVGLLRGFPRTAGHDAALAAAFALSLAAAALWPSTRRIPRLGGLLYVLPCLTLAAAPFALDFWLMLRR